DNVHQYVTDTLKVMQKDIFDRAKRFREENSFEIDDYNEFKNIIAKDGGYVYSHWCGNGECEQKIQEETKATLRCIPLESDNLSGKCIICGSKSDKRVVFAKAY
ncbi:proline--tRNA ligase, partial [candidate division KSB1 bacterium]